MPLAFAGPPAPNPNAPPPRPVALCPNAAASVAVLLLLPAPIPTASILPDAGLLRLCALFHDAEARGQAAPDDGQEWKVWLHRRWEISASIKGMTPRTEAGRQAKARVALVLLEEAVDTTNEYERFVLATLRDLAGAAA